MSSSISSCNSAYDSDEDRHATYLLSMQARKACQSHAHQQRRLLQHYRPQQETQRLLDDDLAERFRPCAAEAHSQLLSPDNDHHISHTSCEDKPAYCAQNFAAWAQHENRWRRIEDGTECIQSLQAIPWPPFSAGIIAALAQHDTTMDQQLSSAKRADNISGLSWRKAYRKALLRWHPDKLSARLVNIQNIAHKESALQRVHQILDRIHNEWAQHMQQS
ncbi:hypothetical protein WJX77_004619 [Trebouxia sp. C0004]